MTKLKNQTTLDEIKKFTTIVADTSDFELIEKYKPQDATTNPSLILKAIQNPNYEDLIVDAISYCKSTQSKNSLDIAILKLFVNFGLKILDVIPGRVSIEVDAKYSFDTQKSIDIAREIISLFEKNNIDKTRILIKLASTYECLKAAEILEKEKISCNMTLLFSMPQAILASQVKATLISPFVGRILDWHKKNEKKEYLPKEDPGVISVKNIFNYYKKHGLKTEIMGASFRNIGEIIELAGCDFLTISPTLLDELANTNIEVQKKLDTNAAKNLPIKKSELNEKEFRYLLNQDAMASEKLSEGIRLFERDINQIKNILSSKI